MKQSKKTAGLDGSKSGEPGEGVTVAARVFGNYVLVPAAGHPDDAAAGSALHGAAVLVLPDEVENVIQLRTVYAAHVGRNTVLRTGEDVSDKSVSSHNNSEEQSKLSATTKEATMARELNCSACGARIPSGAQVCAGCSLPLMAQAVPAIHVTKPRFSLGAIALLSLVAFLIVCYAGSALEADQKKKSDAAFIHDTEAGGALSTPQAFQARCGDATETKATPGGTQLHYGANDLVVTFAPGAAPAFAQRVSFRNDAGKRESFDRPEDQQYALKYLACNAR